MTRNAAETPQAPELNFRDFWVFVIGPVTGATVAAAVLQGHQRQRRTRRPRTAGRGGPRRHRRQARRGSSRAPVKAPRAPFAGRARPRPGHSAGALLCYPSTNVPAPRTLSGQASRHARARHAHRRSPVRDAAASTRRARRSTLAPAGAGGGGDASSAGSSRRVCRNERTAFWAEELDEKADDVRVDGDDVAGVPTWRGTLVRIAYRPA